MRIRDEEHDRELTAVTILLTPEEAVELAQSALALARAPGPRHDHVMSRDGGHEITVAVYANENLDAFDGPTRAMLETDLAKGHGPRMVSAVDLETSGDAGPQVARGSAGPTNERSDD